VLGVRLSVLNREFMSARRGWGRRRPNTRAAQKAVTDAEAELARLRAEAESLRLEVAQLRGRLSGAERPVTSIPATGDTDSATPRPHAAAPQTVPPEPSRRRHAELCGFPARPGARTPQPNPEQEEFMRVAVNDALQSWAGECAAVAGR